MTPARGPCHDQTMASPRSLDHTVRKFLRGARNHRARKLAWEARRSSWPMGELSRPRRRRVVPSARAELSPRPRTGRSPRRDAGNALATGRIRPCDKTPWYILVGAPPDGPNATALGKFLRSRIFLPPQSA